MVTPRLLRDYSVVTPWLHQGYSRITPRLLLAPPPHSLVTQKSLPGVKKKLLFTPGSRPGLHQGSEVTGGSCSPCSSRRPWGEGQSGGGGARGRGRGPQVSGRGRAEGRGYLQNQSDVSSDFGPVARQGIAEPGRGGA